MLPRMHNAQVQVNTKIRKANTPLVHAKRTSGKSKSPIPDEDVNDDVNDVDSVGCVWPVGTCVCAEAIHLERELDGVDLHGV